jgi:hypothetical protein
MRTAPSWSWCSLEQSVIKDTLPHLKTPEEAERTCAPGLVQMLTLRRRPAHSVQDKTNWCTRTSRHTSWSSPEWRYLPWGGAVYAGPRQSIELRGDEGFFVDVVVEG